MARCRTLGLKPDAEAVQMLAQWHEGNFLPYAQKPRKTGTPHPDGQLTLFALEESLSDITISRHFIGWMRCLKVKPTVQRILRQLEAGSD